MEQFVRAICVDELFHIRPSVINVATAVGPNSHAFSYRFSWLSSCELNGFVLYLYGNHETRASRRRVRFRVIRTSHDPLAHEARGRQVY